MTSWEMQLDRIVATYYSLINRDGPNPWKATLYIICLVLLKTLIISPFLLLISPFSIALEMIMNQIINYTINFIIGLLIYYSIIKIYYSDIIAFITRPVPKKKYLSLILSLVIISMIGKVFSFLIISGFILIYSFILIGIKTFSII